MSSNKHQPKRTCIGCRSVLPKEDMVRIVAVQDGAVIDYREKLPGRAAYVCARLDCIGRLYEKDKISRALHRKVRLPEKDALTNVLIAAITKKVGSLITMADKAGKLSAGYSAVCNSLEKGRVGMILYARDIAEGTRERISRRADNALCRETLFTREELGKLLGRELVGVIGIEEQGFADALQREAERLNSLINIDK